MRLVLLVAWAAVAAFGQPFEIISAKGVKVPMRDGVTLTTDIYFPGRNGVVAPGRFPVILERTPYGSHVVEPWAKYFVPQGYIAIGQNVRGRYGSGGHWFPLRDDVNDGYDMAKWLGEQPWFSGKFGTVGTSYPGGTQHALALSNPPYLAAMIPVDSMSNPGMYGLRHHGAFELRFFNWTFCFGNSPSGEYSPGGAAHYPGDSPATNAVLANLRNQVVDYVKALPLRPGTSPLKLAPDYENWLIEAMSHGDYDSFWKNSGIDVVSNPDKYKDIPVYHVSGWYDSWGLQVANLNYLTLKKAKKSPQRLFMGPWTHGGQRVSFSGEAEFGPAAALDFEAFRMRWFDHWLKGTDNGVERDAPVKLFIMGGGDAHKTPQGRLYVGGAWRDEREWPLARTAYTPYYLSADGRLSTAKPGAATVEPTRYLFDPKNPVPTIGGNVSSEGPLMPRGAADQRCRKELWACKDTLPLSARPDVVVFQTPAIDREVEVTGPLVVNLWVSSNATDTDFTAKLVDVYPPNKDYPNGVEFNVADGIIRARYRDSWEKATLMKPGQIYKVSLEMYPTSLRFGKGHRIRVDISSSNFPRFDVNPNTGEPLNRNRRWQVAENAIYHDAEHPSHIVLPVIP